TAIPFGLRFVCVRRSDRAVAACLKIQAFLYGATAITLLLVGSCANNPMSKPTHCLFVMHAGMCFLSYSFACVWSRVCHKPNSNRRDLKSPEHAGQEERQNS